MIISIADIWATAAAQHRRYLSQIIDRKIVELEKLHGPQLMESRVVEFVLGNRAALLGADSSGLLGVIAMYNMQFPTSKDKDAANDIFESIFDYEAFATKTNWEKRPWSAYKLCGTVQYIFCSYCQISPTDTKLPTPAAPHSYRPNIDHFYNKARYPFLALTLGNFVPCCERCNGTQMKGDKNFYSDPHLNPLADQQAIRFDFSLRQAVATRPAGSLYLSDEPENYEIRLVSDDPVTVKASRSIETFQLSARYQIFREAAFRLRRQLMRCRTRLTMIEKDLPFLNAEVSDVVGFDVTNEEYKNVHLGKLKIDLYNEVVNQS